MTVLDERPVDIIGEWTGELVAALQAAQRMTHDEFSELMGVGRRSVAYWHANPEAVPRREIQRALDTVYERLTDMERARFRHALDRRQGSAQPRHEPEVETVATSPAFVGLTSGSDPRVVLEVGGQKAFVSLDEAEQMARRLLVMVDAARPLGGLR